MNHMFISADRGSALPLVQEGLEEAKTAKSILWLPPAVAQEGSEMRCLLFQKRVRELAFFTNFLLFLRGMKLE